VLGAFQQAVRDTMGEMETDMMSASGQKGG